MIALRRTFAILLALFFVILFLPVMVVYRVNSTVANPGFYTDQLRKADIYNFLYDDVLPAATSQIRLGDGSQPGSDFSWVAPYLTTMLKDTLPPEWLQAQTEKTINAMVPYFTGSRDTFVVTIVLKDRVEAGTTAIRNILHNTEFTNRLYEEGANRISSIVTSDTNKLPFPLDESTAQAIVRGLLPANWMVTQLDSAISEVTPYFTGDRDHFVVRVNIAERMDGIEGVLVDVLKREETYNYFVNELLGGMVTNNIPAGLGIIPGVSFDSEEIISTAKQALPLEWYRGQVSSLGDQIFAYLKGTEPNLSITISLADRKPAIVAALGGSLDQKLEQAYNSLPEATPEQAIAILSSLPTDRLPDYRLSGLSYSDLKQMAGMNIEAMLSSVLSSAIPDQISLGESLVSGGSENPLVKTRDYVQNGFTYTDQQLAATAGSPRIENIRNIISSGFTFTEQDLRQAISGDGGEGLANLDQARSIIKTIRQVLMFAWILPFLLLVLIGLLGGRTWGSKLVWAAAVLAVAALIAVIVAGPVFSALAQPQIDKAFAQTLVDSGSFEALLAAKGAAMAQNAVDGFIGGIRLQAFILLLVSAGLVVLGSIWHRRSMA